MAVDGYFNNGCYLKRREDLILEEFFWTEKKQQNWLKELLGVKTFVIQEQSV